MNLRNAVLAGCIAIPAIANANLLVNGSFESGAFSPPSNASQTLVVGNSSITGWTIVADSVSWIGNANPWGLTAAEGTRFLDLTDTQNGAPFGGVTQTIATDIGLPYRLTFDIGSSGPFGFPVAIRATAGATSQVFSVNTSANNIWTRATLDFVATSTTSVIRFEGTNGQLYTGLDNATVLSQVPELPVQALLLIGLVGLGVAVRPRLRRPA